MVGGKNGEKETEQFNGLGKRLHFFVESLENVCIKCINVLAYYGLGPVLVGGKENLGSNAAYQNHCRTYWRVGKQQRRQPIKTCITGS